MITLDKGRFVAPQTVPYSAQLREAGWLLSRGIYSTDKLERVFPFLEHLAPDLKAKLVSGAQSYAKATSGKASEGFEPIVPEGRKLFDFQKADVEFILGRKNTLLAEDAGTGKSCVMVTACNMLDAKKILVICPAIAKYNWLKKEWPKWSKKEYRIAPVNAGDPWPDADVIFINYDIIHRYYKQLTAIEWDVLICDESHRLNNKDAKRTKYTIGGVIRCKKDEAELAGLEPFGKRGQYKAKGIKAKKRIWATATPMDRPSNLWVVCSEFDPEGLGSDWMKFHRRYCALVRGAFGWDTRGSDNLEELGAIMRSKFMIRHDPDKVLDLPPLREDLYILPPLPEVRKAEDVFLDSNMALLLKLANDMGAPKPERQQLLGLVGDAILSNAPSIGKPEYEAVFAEFARLREQTGLAKVPGVVSYIEKCREVGSYPLVIFAYHRSVIKALKEAFPDAACIIGGMSSENRNNEVDKFQDGHTDTFLGNMDAAGEAITLTRASHLVFAEMDWRGRTMIQARKRIHRITQDQPCRVDYLCAAESFDHKMANTVFTKMKDIALTLDLKE